MYKKNNLNWNTNSDFTWKLEIKSQISHHRKHLEFWSKTQEKPQRENLFKESSFIYLSQQIMKDKLQQ